MLYTKMIGNLLNPILDDMAEWLRRGIRTNQCLSFASVGSIPTVVDFFFYSFPLSASYLILTLSLSFPLSFFLNRKMSTTAWPWECWEGRKSRESEQAEMGT